MNSHRSIVALQRSNMCDASGTQNIMYRFLIRGSCGSKGIKFQHHELKSLGKWKLCVKKLKLIVILCQATSLPTNVTRYCVSLVSWICYNIVMENYEEVKKSRFLNMYTNYACFTDHCFVTISRHQIIPFQYFRCSCSFFCSCYLLG